MRARLEAQAAGKKNKKGFMTPERKKKLRVIITIEEDKKTSKIDNFLSPAFAAKESS